MGRLQGAAPAGVRRSEDVPIEGITLKDTLDAYDQHGATAPYPPSEEAEKVSKYLKEISATIEKSTANIKLKEM